MPGITAVIAKRTSHPGCRPIAEGIASRLFGSSKMDVAHSPPLDDVALSVVRLGKDHGGLCQGTSSIVVWYGMLTYCGKSPGKELVHDFEALIVEGKLETWLGRLYGNYQLAAYDARRREFVLVADKVSSHPCYYLETSDWLVVAPEPFSLQVLQQHGWKPVLREEAAFEFMASGNMWTEETFWKDVHRLGPGRFLWHRKGETKLCEHWKMRFDSTCDDEATMIPRLSEAVREDFATLPPGRPVLTLSGGYDSRALLGLLANSNRSFGTVSYSFGEEIAATNDAGVGAYYARKKGAAHFLHKASLANPTRLIQDMERAITATGGENDVVVGQDGFLGAEFYERLAGDYDYLLRGDEFWGEYDYVANHRMAFWECFLFNLDEIPQPLRILKSDAFAAGTKLLCHRREQLVQEARGDGIRANDFKDELRWRNRLIRTIQTMAYYRRCYVEHFAPFLFDHTIEVTRHASVRLRIKKRLFKAMAGKEFPELFLDPNAPTPYKVSQNRFEILYADPRLRAFIKERILDNPSPTFQALFDSSRLERWVNQALQNQPSAHQKSSYNLKRLANSLLRKNMYLQAGTKAMMASLGQLRYPVLDSNYLFRILVLAMTLPRYETSE